MKQVPRIDDEKQKQGNAGGGAAAAALTGMQSLALLKYRIIMMILVLG